MPPPAPLHHLHWAVHFYSLLQNSNFFFRLFVLKNIVSLHTHKHIKNIILVEMAKWLPAALIYSSSKYITTHHATQILSNTIKNPIVHFLWRKGSRRERISQWICRVGGLYTHSCGWCESKRYVYTPAYRVCVYMYVCKRPYTLRRGKSESHLAFTLALVDPPTTTTTTTPNRIVTCHNRELTPPDNIIIHFNYFFSLSLGIFLIPISIFSIKQKKKKKNDYLICSNKQKY